MSFEGQQVQGSEKILEKLQVSSWNGHRRQGQTRRGDDESPSPQSNHLFSKQHHLSILVTDLPEDQSNHHSCGYAAHAGWWCSSQRPRSTAMRRGSSTCLLASVCTEARRFVLLLCPRHFPAEHPRHSLRDTACEGERSSPEEQNTQSARGHQLWSDYGASIYGEVLLI